MPFSQIILNTIIRGSQLGLLALSVTIIFAILRFANFSHSEFAVVGAYLALLLTTTGELGSPIKGRIKEKKHLPARKNMPFFL